jgi:hypothetical protein
MSSAAGDDAANALHGLHISTRVPPGRPLDVVCKFWVAGYCANGPACRFQHPPREGDARPTENVPAAPRRLAPPSAASFVRRDRPGTATTTAPPPDHPAHQSPASSDGYVSFADAYASVFRPSDAAFQPDRYGTGHADARSYAGAAGAAGAAHALGDNESRPHVRNRWAGAPITAPPVQTVLCRYHLEGAGCKYGSRCMYLHGSFCSSCLKNAIHPTDNAQAARHVEECTADEGRRARVKASASIDCGTLSSILSVLMSLATHVELSCSGS